MCVRLLTDHSTNQKHLPTSFEKPHQGLGRENMLILHNVFRHPAIETGSHHGITWGCAEASIFDGVFLVRTLGITIGYNR